MKNKKSEMVLASDNYAQPMYNFAISTAGFESMDKVVNKIFASENINLKVFRNLKMYLINLKTSDGKVAVIQRAEYFSKLKSKWHTRTYAKIALDLLLKHNLISLHTGYISSGFKSGFSSVIESTEKFDRIFGKCQKKDYYELQISEPIETVEVIRDKTIDTKVIHYESLYHIDNIALANKWRDMFRRIQKVRRDDKISGLNEVDYLTYMLDFSEISLKDTELSRQFFKNSKLCKNILIKRVFHEHGYGRYYTTHGLSYQNVPRDVRQKCLLLDGKPVVELDYSAMHINLFYAMKNTENPHVEDSYMPVVKELVGYDSEELRNAVKSYFIIALNAPTIKQTHQALADKHRGNTKDSVISVLKKHDLRLIDVLKAIKKVHPVLVPLLGSDLSHMLQFFDSEILTHAMKKLVGKGCVVLPLHDALLTHECNIDVVMNAMKEAYNEYTGFEIKVEVKK